MKAIRNIAQLGQVDLTFLRDLMTEGKLKPVIEKTYSIGQTADALRYLEEGHARGKIVITLDPTGI
jgi:D-arabinose 1-dehydrogenase-like Zn-dependent alcohol dehydrogenase